MMNRFLLAAVLFVGAIDFASAYEPVGNNIMTTWGENINPAEVWQEYPRPIMEESQRIVGLCHCGRRRHSPGPVSG